MPVPVLLLNYNADERTTYCAALEAAGFEVIVASTPPEALTLAVSRRPSALVTRVLQPGSVYDGIELVRRMKRDPLTATIPIVITSSLLEVHHAEAAAEAGCDEYLVLPVAPEAVARAVARAIACTAAMSAAS